MQISITLALSKFSLSCASFTSLFVYLTFYPINLGGVEKLASFDIARVPYNHMYSSQFCSVMKFINLELCIFTILHIACVHMVHFFLLNLWI